LLFFVLLVYYFVFAFVVLKVATLQISSSQTTADTRFRSRNFEIGSWQQEGKREEHFYRKTSLLSGQSVSAAAAAGKERGLHAAAARHRPLTKGRIT
jgi:hypothetical protein